jgi:hypothetical protein
MSRPSFISANSLPLAFQPFGDTLANHLALLPRLLDRGFGADFILAGFGEPGFGGPQGLFGLGQFALGDCHLVRRRAPRGVGVV